MYMILDILIPRVFYRTSSPPVYPGAAAQKRGSLIRGKAVIRDYNSQPKKSGLYGSSICNKVYNQILEFHV